MAAGDPTDNAHRLLDELLAIREVLGEETARSVDPQRIPTLNDRVADPPAADPEDGVSEDADRHGIDHGDAIADSSDAAPTKMALENVDEEALEEFENSEGNGASPMQTDIAEDAYSGILDIDVAIPCFTLRNVAIDEDEPEGDAIMPSTTPAPLAPEIPGQGGAGIGTDAGAEAAPQTEPEAGFRDDHACESPMSPEILVDTLVAEWLPALENALRERLMAMTPEQLEQLRQR